MIMFKQMSFFLENIFSKGHCIFRKSFLTQQCYLTLLKKWKNAVDKGKSFGALLIVLSKVFDCLNRELLIAKINTYGFTLPSSRLFHDYLSNRKQRVRVRVRANDLYSLQQDILLDVPQGYILDLLLFNIALADLFFTLCNTGIANQVDGTMPFAVSDDIDDSIASLERSSNDLLNPFHATDLF